MRCSSRIRVCSGVVQRGCRLALAVLLVTWGGRGWASDTSIPSPVERITQAAIDCGIAGDTGKRQRMLQAALALQPDFAPARWEAGYLQVGGQWLKVDEAQAAARTDRVLQQYAALRQTLADTPADHQQVAVWCQEQGLHDEARFHWLRVLAARPQHVEALSALNLTWYEGQLVARDKVDELKQQAKRQRDADRQWKQAIARWERWLQAGEGKGAMALTELRRTVDVMAIPEFERLAARTRVPASQGRHHEQLSLAFVDVLGEITEFDATKSLVRHALFAPSEAVRAAASTKLKHRPLHATVPLILSYLEPPIESNLQVHVDSAGGVNYWHELYTEGPMANYAVEFGATNIVKGIIRQVPTGPVGSISRTKDQQTKLTAGDLGLFQTAVADVQLRVALAVRRQARTAHSAAVKAQQAIDAENVRRTRLAERGTEVLNAVTGEDYGSDLTAWWKYWLQYNEYEYPEKRPTYNLCASYCFETYVTPGSCFVAGTPVWTKSGTAPIESLGAGDLVLTQDVQTGELRYFPVLATTTREPSSTLRISTGDGEIQATLGHPFWVPGNGWRMAKELTVGDRIRSVNGPVTIYQILPGEEKIAYNLIVDGPGNYFVGTEGLLVHDNTPRDAQTFR